MSFGIAFQLESETKEKAIVVYAHTCVRKMLSLIHIYSNDQSQNPIQFKVEIQKDLSLITFIKYFNFFRQQAF
jgi:hypothetical protein